MNNQKNRFWTFCFSLIPGAGEMYFGLYRMGMSLMLCFFGLLLIPMAINLAVFSLLAVILWFYSFLHVHNLRNLPLEEFCQIEDRFIWEDLDIQWNPNHNKSLRKAAAVLLIVVGVFLLWDNFTDLLGYFTGWSFLYDIIYSFTYRLPQLALAVIIILVGLKLIGGKKKELEQEESESDKYSDLPLIQPPVEKEERSDEDA